MFATQGLPAESGDATGAFDPWPSELGVEISVLIVDDHRSFADLLAAALRSTPGIRVVATAYSIETAVRAAETTRPDIVVMDIDLGGQDGLHATRLIRAEEPGVLVVVVSAHTDPTWIARAAGAGANGYAPKSGPLDELLTVLRHARLGKFFVARSLIRSPAAEAPAQDHVHLTPRESEVLALLADGAGPAEIARILGISLHTCRDHVKALYAKLDARSQLEVLAKARRSGLFTDGDE